MTPVVIFEKRKFLCLAAITVLVPLFSHSQKYTVLMAVASCTLLFLGHEVVSAFRVRRISLRVSGLETTLCYAILLSIISVLFSSCVYVSVYTLIASCFLLSVFFLIIHGKFPQKNKPVLVYGILSSSLLHSAFIFYQRIFDNTNYTIATKSQELAFAVTGIVILISYLVGNKRKDITKGVMGYSLVGGMVLLLLEVYIYGSLVHFLSLLSSCAYLFFMKRNKVLIPVMCFLCLMVFTHTRQKSLLDQESNCLKTWGASASIIKDNPVLGTGLGNFRFRAPPYNFPSEGLIRYRPLANPRSSLLLLGAELGIPGLILYFMFWIRVLKRCIKKKRAPGFRNGEWVELSVESALLGIFVLSLGSTLDLRASFLGAVLLGLFYWDKKNLGIIECQSISECTDREVFWLKGFSLILIFLTWLLFAFMPYIGERYYVKATRDKLSDTRAIETLKAAKACSPLNPGFYNKMGEIYSKKFYREGRMSSFEKAERYFKVAVSKNRYNEDFRENLGKLFYGRYLKEKKDEYLKKSVVFFLEQAEINPMGIRPKVNIASVCIQAKEYIKAEKIIMETVELEPNFVEGWYTLYLIRKELRKADIASPLNKSKELAKRLKDFKITQEDSYTKRVLKIPKALQ